MSDFIPLRVAPKIDRDEHCGVEMLYIIDTHGEPLAAVQVASPGHIGPAEWEIARLMAAAPMLYNALEGLLPVVTPVEDTYRGLPSQRREAISRAQAALALVSPGRKY